MRYNTPQALPNSGIVNLGEATSLDLAAEIHRVPLHALTTCRDSHSLHFTWLNTQT